jgi:hypothetical protein
MICLDGVRLSLEEEVDEQEALDRRRIMPDLVVSARSHRRVLKPIERALAPLTGRSSGAGR